MLAALLLAAAGDAQAASQLPALGFPELARRALAENPWILAKRARGRSLAHTEKQKTDESNWRGWDLGLDAEYYPGTGGGSQLAGYDTRVSLGLTVPLFGSQAERNLRLQEIQAEQSIVDGELGETSRLVLVSLLGHYLTYWRSVEMREPLAQIAEKIQEKRAILAARVREGESLPADLLEAERDHARIVLRIEQNREAERFALEEMRSGLGDPLLPEFLPQPLPWRKMAAQSPEPVATMESRAVQGHPMILGLESRIRLLHEQEEETSGAYPRSAFTVGLVSQMGGAGGNESGPAMSFSMSLPLGASRILAERRRAIAADRDRYHADLSRRRQEIGAEIRARFQDLLVSQEKSRLAASQWSLASERERVAKLQAKELPDLAEPSLALRALDAEIDRLEASMQKDAAESELAGSYCKILLAVDRALPDPRREPVAGAARGPLDLWVWSAEIVSDHGERRRFFDLAGALGVEGIYLGLDLRETETLWEESPGALRGFLTECHERGIRVECLLAENGWALPAERSGLIEMLGRFSRFQAGSTRLARYDALHLDVEPHALPEWGKSEETRAGLVRGYLEMIEQCRQRGVPLHVDLPSWYERVPAGEMNLLLAVLRRVEGVAIMNYRTDAERFRKEMDEELRAATEEGKTIRIGVSAESLLPESQAFRRWDDLVRLLEDSAAHCRSFESFAGFAVQSLADLRGILPGEVGGASGERRMR